MNAAALNRMARSNKATRPPVRVFSFYDDGFRGGPAEQSTYHNRRWENVKSWLARQGYPDMNDEGVLQRLHDSEINANILFQPDGTFDVKLGDDWNGYTAEAKLSDWRDVLKWLREQELLQFPASVFAGQETGKSREEVLREHSKRERGMGVEGLIADVK